MNEIDFIGYSAVHSAEFCHDIPNGYKGKLAIPVSGLFYLNPLHVKHLGNINNKKVNEEVGLLGFDKTIVRDKNGNIMEVTLGVKDGKIGASRVVVELF